MQESIMYSLEIKTSRTILKLISQDYLEPVAVLNSDPEIRKFFLDGVLTREQTRQKIIEFMNTYEQTGLPCFVILEKSSGVFIGRCGFAPMETGETEVFCLIARKFWRKGYASEILKAILAWSRKNIEADFITGFSPVAHFASHGLMEKCGMKYCMERMEDGVLCKFYRFSV